MAHEDPRRFIPRTDVLLASPEARQAQQRLGETAVRRIITQVQDQARAGSLAPEEVPAAVGAALAQASPSSLRPVLNATGVLVHTNLGRAPLSDSAKTALQDAAGYVDVELDLATGKRSSRGVAARRALVAACPGTEDALVVNNGAAALLLATTALAGSGGHGANSGDSAGDDSGGRTPRVVISRGELIEIGAGFRLPELIESTSSQLIEVGATNRTHLSDYRSALQRGGTSLLKVHPSNFRVSGFTGSVGVPELRALADEFDVPLIVDLGSGLLAPDPLLPDEPDIATALADGADVVIISGDKLLGGPQAGILLGRAEAIATLAQHPLARALRTDKLTLAALEATVSGPTPPVAAALHADTAHLRVRAEALARAVGGGVVPHDGRVGGGGAPGVPLPGCAVSLPEGVAAELRAGSPAVLARVHDGVCLVDLRCVPQTEDARLSEAVVAALKRFERGAH